MSVVSIVMAGTLVLALLAASHGTVVAVAIAAFLTGRNADTVRVVGRRAARTLRQTVHDSSIVESMRRVIATA
jgi:hypothetical protein